MQISAIFTIVSQLYVEQDQSVYNEITSPEYWRNVIEYKYLDTSIHEALTCPLPYAEHQRFCRQHFFGGLPESALPVESLYERPEGLASQTAKQGAPYLGNSARYMIDLISSMGLTLPHEFQAIPDHLSLECDIYTLLRDSNQKENADIFLKERFTWLDSYKNHLDSLNDPAAYFFSGLIQLLIEIRNHAQQ